MNRRQWLSVWGFAIGAAALRVSSAQDGRSAPASTDAGRTSSVARDDDAPLPQRAGSGIDYISGGAGEEERTAMKARQADFPFTVVFAMAEGEYLVADRLSVKAPQGDLLIVRDAGPIVMMRLPPGRYVLEAEFAGRTERRSVAVGGAPQTVVWRGEG